MGCRGMGDEVEVRIGVRMRVWWDKNDMGCEME